MGFFRHAFQKLKNTVFGANVTDSEKAVPVPRERSSENRRRSPGGGGVAVGPIAA